MPFCGNPLIDTLDNYILLPIIVVASYTGNKKSMFFCIRAFTVDHGEGDSC
jgi:hypothetical protein